MNKRGLLDPESKQSILKIRDREVLPLLNNPMPLRLELLLLTLNTPGILVV
jgi:hypothetical protein